MLCMTKILSEMTTILSEMDWLTLYMTYLDILRINSLDVFQQACGFLLSHTQLLYPHQEGCIHLLA